jgi:NADP-dependent 3-hydroxy acid dehydrogenase YdfG
VEALIKSTVDAFGKVDVLFNNAGVMLLSQLEQQQYTEWEQMLDTNVKGMLYGIGATLPYFKQQRSGHFINVRPFLATGSTPPALCTSHQVCRAGTE